jgi:cellulose synthase/poly-beta-1,6-N-acetylglucosamine synthase-like glycosyltransferase
VITAFRNERENLPCLLEALAQQKYPSNRYEIILVDDHSDDGSTGIAGKFCAGNPAFRLVSNGREENGKKDAILNGLKCASFGLVVTTDADCTMSENWLSAIAGFYGRYKPEMIIGLVDITETKGFFGKFREIEFLSLIASGAAAAAERRPLYCSGANLAYDKAIFTYLDDPLKRSVVSGDDMLLMLDLKKKTRNGILLLKSLKAVVGTKGVASWKEYMDQRKRWMSKSRYYSDRDVVYTACLVFTTSLFLIISGILCIAGHHPWLFPALLAGKTIADYFFLRSFMSFYGKKPPVRTFVLYELIYPIYIVTVALSGIITGYHWKERYHRVSGTKTG